ncbi:MAG: starch-binding protein [Winogradskyella sp.]|uniref:starch-binding protein n=1 Tax=Winogradskyella sp. TaxID=1883156 RepID=UPI000F408551|nr:starch-binding protein [Winogradskyella sp.]RNC86454.1 MAG: starch-binding protein [Winogradskyella sp.]
MKKNYFVFPFFLVFSFWFYGQVHTSYLWHLQQPIYWPDKSVSNPYEYQKVWESQQLKFNGGNIYADGIAHPLNDLEEIFSKPDRVNVYQWEARNSINSITSLPDAGAQVNYGGCLIENIQSLSDAGAWGYVPNWTASVIEAQGWQTSGGFPRMDVTGFTWHHALSPLISDRVLRKEIQGHKYIVQNYFNGNISPGYWPAECSFSERIIQVLVEEGFEWSIIANSHLSRTLNDYPVTFGTSGVNTNPPNLADKVTTNGTNWWSGQIDGRGGTFAAPYSYQAHKAKYVNPETGQEYKLTVVPMADLLSYRDGFSEQGTGELDANIAPYDDPNHPSIVLLAHDGDNAWGGGASYYQQAVQNFSNAAASQGYSPTTIQQFLNDHPVSESDIVKVEDGSWFNAENDWGSPQFINWLWPMYTSEFEFDPNGWTEDARNWAVLTAAENYVIMAEDLEGNTDIADIVNPSVSSSKAELAWHALLPGYTSGYMYYGKSIDMEIKQTIASNNAVDYAQDVIDSNPGVDATPPSVFIPQRYPYNPGEIGFGPTYGYQQHLNSADFTVWTFAHDVNGIASAELKYRIDNDGVNPLSNNDNETYAGGNSVGNWESLTMIERIFPKTNITNDPEIDFFVLPEHIANQYHAEITGLSEVLVDYYVEITDNNGNVTKSKIQHVWVGENLDVNPTVSFLPENNFSPDPLDVTILASDSTDPNPTLYYTTDESEPTTSSPSVNQQTTINITETTTFKAFAVDVDNNQSNIVTKTYFIGDVDGFTVYFKPPDSWTSAPKVYWWDILPDGVLEDAAWPGVDMIEACDGWYSYEFVGVASTNIIFNDGLGTNQTVDLSASGEAYYEWDSMSWISNPNITQPCLTINPLGGTFANGSTVDVTVTATDSSFPNPTIYYTIDGTEPTTSSSSATNAVNIQLNSTTTLKAFAQNSNGDDSSVKTENYTFEDLDSFTVFFRPPSDWTTTPNVYWWNASPNGVLSDGNWPGITMELHDSEWYKYTFTNIESINIIFNNGSSGVGINQTDDIIGVNEDLWFDWFNGVLSINSPELNNDFRVYPNPVESIIRVDSSTTFNRFTIHDITGKLIRTGSIINNAINVGYLNKGVYILNLKGDNNISKTVRFIK